MIYAYIGVILVVSLLIGFAALAVYWLARSVGRSIRSRTVELISAYDDLLEVRSRQLAQLERQAQLAQPAAAPLEQVQRAPAAAPNVSLNMVARIGATPYRSDLFGAAYRQIWQSFDFSPETVLRQLQKQSPGPGAAPATELLAGLSCDVVCELAALPGETQYQLLYESLAPAQQALLQAYREARAEFDSLDFYDHLRQTAYAEPKAPRLRVAPAAGVAPLQGATLQEDDAICEGFQLEANGRIYDYCIKTREIS